MALRGAVRDKRKFAPGAGAYDRRFVGRNKAKHLPLTRADPKQIMAAFFGSAPHTHVARMMDAVALIEAKPRGAEGRYNAARARSEAWAGAASSTRWDRSPTMDKGRAGRPEAILPGHMRLR